MSQTKTKTAKVIQSAKKIRKQMSKRVVFGQAIETVSFLNVSAVLKLGKV